MPQINQMQIAKLLDRKWQTVHNCLNFIPDFPPFTKVNKVYCYSEKAVLLWISKHDVDAEIKKALKRRYQYYYPQIADKAIAKKKCQEQRPNPLDNRSVVKFLSCGPKKYGASSGNPANRQTVQVKSDWM